MPSCGRTDYECLGRTSLPVYYTMDGYLDLGDPDRFHGALIYVYKSCGYIQFASQLNPMRMIEW